MHPNILNQFHWIVSWECAGAFGKGQRSGIVGLDTKVRSGWDQPGILLEFLSTVHNKLSLGASLHNSQEKKDHSCVTYHCWKDGWVRDMQCAHPTRKDSWGAVFLLCPGRLGKYNIADKSNIFNIFVSGIIRLCCIFLGGLVHAVIREENKRREERNFNIKSKQPVRWTVSECIWWLNILVLSFEC